MLTLRRSLEPLTAGMLLLLVCGELCWADRSGLGLQARDASVRLRLLALLLGVVCRVLQAGAAAEQWVGVVGLQ